MVENQQDMGAPLTAPGSREPSPGGLGPSGFDPSRGCDMCSDENGDRWFPMYGVAPHECFWKKGPAFTIGQSTLVPFEPADCFVPDLEDDEDWSAFAYPAACGVFYCPRCDRQAYEAAWSELVARIGEPPAAIGMLCEHEKPQALSPVGVAARADEGGIAHA